MKRLVAAVSLVVVLVLVIFFLAGRPKQTAQQVSAKIGKGMTTAEVKSKAGSPNVDKDLGGGKRAFVYHCSDRKVVVFFEGDKVASSRATDQVELR